MSSAFDGIDCPPVRKPAEGPQSSSILSLAAELGSAADRYRASMDAREDFRTVLRHAGALARAADALTTAIADAVACGNGQLT